MVKITSGLLVLSCILSWIGFAFGVRLAPALEDGISEYNKRRDRTTAFQVSRGNAVWIGLVGAVRICGSLGEAVTEQIALYYFGLHSDVVEVEVCHKQQRRAGIGKEPRWGGFRDSGLDPGPHIRA